MGVIENYLISVGLDLSNPFSDKYKWEMAKESIKQNGNLCYAFGIMFRNGDAPLYVSDFQLAYEFFKAGASLGEVTCIYYTGLSFYEGLGCAIDYEQAAKYFVRAADRGYENAIFNAAMSYKRLGDQENFIEWLMKADAIRDFSAMKMLAATFGTFEIYRLRAEHGDLSGMYDYGVSLFTGEYGPADPETALYWFEKAANLGYLDAMYNVGAFYDNGLGCKQDLKKAWYWFSKGAALGHENCKKAMNNPSRYCKDD